jgi:predicted enzyme related to lactoylglutathione lyase
MEVEAVLREVRAARARLAKEGPAPFMVNYRVRDLDAMLAQLRAAGAQVDDRVEDYDYGRFGWATDPEGNRFELWEPRSAGQG